MCLSHFSKCPVAQTEQFLDNSAIFLVFLRRKKRAQATEKSRRQTGPLTLAVELRVGLLRDMPRDSPRNVARQCSERPPPPGSSAVSGAMARSADCCNPRKGSGTPQEECGEQQPLHRTIPRSTATTRASGPRNSAACHLFRSADTSANHGTAAFLGPPPRSSTQGMPRGLLIPKRAFWSSDQFPGIGMPRDCRVSAQASTALKN